MELEIQEKKSKLGRKLTFAVCHLCSKMPAMWWAGWC